MLEFVPGQFRSDYETIIGRTMWAFLNRAENVARLEVATELERPALCGVEEPLLQIFGDYLHGQRTKQMLGLMVRQIMEDRGFELIRSHVRLNSVPFYAASRYRRRGQTSVYLFRNSDDHMQMCVSATRRGALPKPGRGRWTFVNVISSPAKARIGYGLCLDAAALRAAKGAFLHQMPRAGSI